MAIVTGDRYLDLLSTFIEENTSPLLEGALVLKLNPVGLYYLQARLEQLEELEALRVGAPVDYLRAYVADLGDHRALEQLRRVLRLLSSVKVVAMDPAASRDPTPITLLPFSRLRVLELRGCDLSTSAARGLLELRPILEKLVCYNSSDSLRHIFSERTKEIQDAPVWSRLADVSCFSNGMLLMDESLQLLPAVETLDLSRNRFAKVANLQKCSKLTYLDAGFNNITTVASLNKILRNVTKLILRNNAVASTRGLHRIASLEALDLSYNLISNFREVELLGDLPSLRFLWLEGNPLTVSRWYRREALSYFREPLQLVLDGRQTSIWESMAARRVAARRLKQSSKYGAFSPAQTSELPQLSDSEQVEETSSRALSIDGPSSSTLRARKKNSRLASILDESGPQSAHRTGSLLPDTPICSIATSDSATPRQSVVENKEQIEETVQDLIERAEVLKRSGSTCWLKDLNALLENEIKAKAQKSAVPNTSQGKLWEKRRRRRSFDKGRLREPTAASRNSDSSNEFDKPESSWARSTSLDELQKSFVDAEKQPSISSGVPIDLNDGNGLKLDPSVTFRTQELGSGKMRVGSSSSPPQYDEALLRRRQTLERELLQLSPQQDISPSDSETSSGTLYPYLSDSSDSPPHSPSAVWRPYRFDHAGKSTPSGKSEGSESEDNYEVWTDNEAPEQDASETGEFQGRDLTAVDHADEGPSHSEKWITPTVHMVEATVGNLISISVPIADGKPIENELMAAVHTVDLKKNIQNRKDGVEVTIFVGPETVAAFPLEAPDAVGEHTACIDTKEEKEAEEAVSEESEHSNLVQRSPTLQHDIGPSKDNRGGHEERIPFHIASLLQPRSKSSRRIVRLEPLAGVAESSVWINPPKEIHDLSSEDDGSTSLGVNRVAESVLGRSHSSAVQYKHPFNITRSFSAGSILDKREWSRKRSQEDVLASTSVQQGESHEAADSNLQFHRAHHVVGPCVGQCA